MCDRIEQKKILLALLEALNSQEAEEEDVADVFEREHPLMAELGLTHKEEQEVIEEMKRDQL